MSAPDTADAAALVLARSQQMEAELTAEVEDNLVREADNIARTTAGLLDAVVTELNRFVVFGDSAAVIACALWVLHTYVFEVFETTPYLAITSASKRSGKSRLLELLSLLVARAWYVTEPTEATLFRKVEAARPTLLVDEMDASFGKDPAGTEGLRAIYNAGYRSGATVPRCVGQSHDVRDFSVYCPKAFAGIKALPDTVADRSIPIALHRRASHERQPERFRLRDTRERLAPLVAAIADWADDAAGLLVDARPRLPECLSDRAQDGWESLLAIAELAGDCWREKSWMAAQELSADVEDDDLGVALLTHCRDAFGAEHRLETIVLLRRLVERGDESPWARWWGDDLDSKPPHTKGPASRLAKMLKPYGIAPTQIRIGEVNHRGYVRAHFDDAWIRYCPPPRHGDRKNATTLRARSEAETHRPSLDLENGAEQERSDVASSGSMEQSKGSYHDDLDPAGDVGEISDPAVLAALDREHRHEPLTRDDRDTWRWEASTGERS